MRCLDTNVVIAVLNDSSPRVTARFDSLALLGDLALPVIVLFELRYGLAKSTRRPVAEKRIGTLLGLPLEILPMLAADAEHAAEIRADLKRKGTPIGPYDVLIAAQARCRGATLVTAKHARVRPRPGAGAGGLDLGPRPSPRPGRVPAGL